MKLNKSSKLVSLLTAGAMLLSPKANALEGIVMNSITDEGIPNAIVKLYEGETLLDSVRTNGDGYYRVNPTSVRSPEVNLPNINNYEIKVFDIHGRFLYKLNNSWNGATIPNLPSGSYIFATPNKAFAMPVIEGNLLFPIKTLTERTLTNKNRNKISDADEVYTLSVSDDSISQELLYQTQSLSEVSCSTISYINIKSLIELCQN